MAYKTNNTVTIADTRAFSLANVTVQNNGFIEVNSSDTFQGTVAGYAAGGFISPSSLHNIIEKFPFSADSNATDVGDLTEANWVNSSGSSTSNGYVPISWTGSPTARSRRLNKFSFASNNNAADIGQMVTDGFGGLYGGAGHSSQTSGYASGGFPQQQNTIEKYSFVFDSNSTDIGDLTQARNATTGQSSTVSGYTSGGGTNPESPTIDKFPFATDTNATDVGDLTQSRRYLTGQSSTVSGYTSGGSTFSPVTRYNTIDKFPFASDANATDVGDLTNAVNVCPSGTNSSVSGYVSGGEVSSPSAFTNTIQKYPFATDTNASDVGDLTLARGGMGSNGAQD